MAGMERKIKRNMLKKHLNSNKIRDFYHSYNDTLEKRMREAKREAKK